MNWLKKEKELTDIWRKYEKCKSYMDKKALVRRTNENWNFYIGNQWEGCNTDGEKLPVLNFIESIVKYKVSVVSQNSMTAKYSDLAEQEGSEEICELLNKLFEEAWEKAKMNISSWEIIEASAVQGDSYGYWGDCDPKKPPQILPNTCVMLGDENTQDIQKQPFIILVERLDVKTVKKIAKENKISAEDIELITPDDNKDLQIVNKEEVTDKVTSLLFMTKKNGHVEIARSTKSVIYEKQHAIEATDSNGNAIRGLKSYPIVSFIWKKKPNMARGVSEVEQLIPNQIEVNKTIARRSMTVKLTAYPRLAYDAAAVQNPEDIDKVGAAIEVNGGAQSVNQMISYLSTANISSDADKLMDDLISLSRELGGAGDYATGNVNPEQASGEAILAVRDQAQIPLNKQIAQYQQFVEDVAMLYFDLWVAYNPNGINYKGNIIPIESLEMLKPSVKIDVSQDNAWSKLAEQQWIDKMFERQQITFEEYVELSNSNSVPKGKLEAILKRRKMEQMQQQQMLEQQQLAQQPEMADGLYMDNGQYIGEEM